jgi:hypothetical protein
MTTRPSIHRSGRAATAALAMAVVLAGATAGTAAAKPPALDLDTCATTLAGAGSWPGAMSGAAGVIRLVSDGHDGYLSRSAACQTET